MTRNIHSFALRSALFAAILAVVGVLCLAATAHAASAESIPQVLVETSTTVVTNTQQERLEPEPELELELEPEQLQVLQQQVQQQVQQQEEQELQPPPKHDKPVKIELYYMPQCPGCRQLLTSSFHDAFDTPGFSDMADVTFVPYGRTPESQHTRVFDHTIETCALAYIARGGINFDETEESDGESDNHHNHNNNHNNHHHQEDQFRYIDCIDRSQNAAAEEVDVECAKIAGLSGVAILMEILRCAKGEEGAELARRAADQADRHHTRLHYFPWIVVDNEHNEEIERKVWESLFHYVCGVYTGPKRSPHCDNGGKEKEKEEEDGDDLDL